MYTERTEHMKCSNKSFPGEGKRGRMKACHLRTITKDEEKKDK